MLWFIPELLERVLMDKEQPTCQPLKGQVTRLAQMRYAEGRQGFSTEIPEWLILYLAAFYVP